MVRLSQANLLRHSLIVLWFGTAIVSLLNWQRMASDLLIRAGLTSDPLIHILISAGSAADLAVGLLLCCKPGRTTYFITLLMLALMTAIATWLLPILWLDPLAPLLKNLPIAAIVLVLLQMEKPPCTAT